MTANQGPVVSDERSGEPGLEELVPEELRHLLDASDAELKTGLPRVARDRDLMDEVASAAKSVPTSHRLFLGDSRDLSALGDGSVHLVVTSPPYFNLKDYENGSERQLGDLDDYGEFHAQLDMVWRECFEKLVPGGRMCVVVGDVLRSRRSYGRHRVVPLHATIQEHCVEIGFDNLAPVIWHKIGNASLEAGTNSRFLGKPYEPGAVIKNDVEYVLLFRKPGGYRSPSTAQRILSLIEADEHQRCFRQVWDDVNGERQRDHPAPYPVELAERLVRMFSFTGDTVLDPFAGTGTTAIAASGLGRNSVSVEIEAGYVDIAEARLSEGLSSSTQLEIALCDKP